MDRVFIKGLRVETVIGVHDWERRIRQHVSLDIEMSSDTARAAAADDFTEALDYEAVGTRIVDLAGHSSFELIETLAERVAQVVREEFSVAWVRVRLSKGAALRGANEVGVEIERGDRPA